MTVATSIANSVPGAVDASPAAAAGGKGLGRTLEASTFGAAQGFATAFQSALTVETSTVRPERALNARESRTPVSRTSRDFLPAKASSTPAPDARLAKATPERTEADRPEPARGPATKAQTVRSEVSRSEQDRPDDVKTAPAARQLASAQSAESPAKHRQASTEAVAAPADPTTADSDTTETNSEEPAGIALVAAAVSSAPPEPVAPELYWGDMEGTRLASEEAPLMDGASEAEPEAGSTVNEALTSLLPTLRSVAPQGESAPKLGSSSSGPIQFVATDEATDEEQPRTAADALPQLTAEQDKLAATTPTAPTAMAAIPVAVTPEAAPTATSHTPDHQPAVERRLSDRASGPHAEGVDLPEAAELTAPSTKNPIAFTMQLKVAESGTEGGSPLAAPQVAAPQAAEAQAAALGVAARTDLETGGDPTLPKANADSPTGPQPAHGPAAPTASTAAGDREPQRERHSGGDKPSGQEPSSPSGQPAPAAEKASATPAVTTPTSSRVEAAAAARGSSATRTITATEAVADAGGTRAEQVKNLPRPVGPQRLALRVDPPPVAGTSAAPAPGRAVELYLEQRGADVHFDVRSADPSMVSDLQGSVKDLSNRLEQAGFRTESFLPSDAVRGAGQSATANNSGTGDDEPSQRQPGENPQGQSGQQSNGRDARQNRDGQQPRWRNEFEEMFGSTATPATALRTNQ
ncbi:MAG: hypothetical protein NTV70_24890 [Acidobacteria bacterium]|nr:hypothetical protein [Acidobacteriota bacterium]